MVAQSAFRRRSPIFAVLSLREIGVGGPPACRMSRGRHATITSTCPRLLGPMHRPGRRARPGGRSALYGASVGELFGLTLSGCACA